MAHPLATSAPRPAQLLSLSNISKRFGGTLALDGIDWSVAEGEVHCLVGENGSGKSTLIKILSGVHAPDPGGAIIMRGRAPLGSDARTKHGNSASRSSSRTFRSFQT